MSSNQPASPEKLNQSPNRRQFVAAAAAALAAPMVHAAGQTRMTIQLSCGAIGVKADQRKALQYAHEFGFQSIDADSGWLSTASPTEVSALLEEMKAKNVVWANSGLSVEFRKDEQTFRQGMAELPKRAQALHKAGVSRVSTWIMPCHDTLTYMENFKQHTQRLGEVAKVLADSDCRLGLEYVGPKTLWSSKMFPFVHTMREMKELIAATGQNNVGFVLDSWHWFTARETAADLATLKNSDIVSVDLNDAPQGRTVDEQLDGQREVPCSTGVIPAGDFLNALAKLGCDAPVRCEPFNAKLRAMPPEQALEVTIGAMKKAFALIA